jgi:translation elongation factor EF-G
MRTSMRQDDDNRTNSLLFRKKFTNMEVHEGGAQMDWMEQEQERGITITSAATKPALEGQHD